jgi:hypothetical protein
MAIDDVQSSRNSGISVGIRDDKAIAGIEDTERDLLAAVRVLLLRYFWE